MTRYLLDTTVLIDVSKHREAVESRVLELLEGPDEVGVSVVNVAELFSGLRPESRHEALLLLDELEVWPVTREVAERAGDYRYGFARQGRTILLPDALVAATASVLGAVLLTNNVKDFRMPDVEVVRLHG